MVAAPRCCGRLRGYAASTAGERSGLLDFVHCGRPITECASELAEPQKLLSHLLQPGINTLPPDVVAVYVQAAMKVFGSWAAELAERWDDDDLPRVQGVVGDILERLQSFAAHPDIEVQERVRRDPPGACPCARPLALGPEDTATDVRFFAGG